MILACLLQLCPIWAALGMDLIFLSPLQAGRAFFYDCLSADPANAKFSLLLRYFRRGFWRTLLWRVGLWSRYAFWWCLCSLPALCLEVYRFSAATPTGLWNMVLLFVSYLLWICGAVAALAFSSRYQAAVYALPYCKPTAALFKTKADNALLQSQLRYVLCFPLFLLIVPYFYASFTFRCEQAHHIRRQNADFGKEMRSRLATPQKLW